MNLSSALPKIYASFSNSERNHILSGFDTRALLIVTLLYILALISLPLYEPQYTIWFGVYPILMAPLFNLSYGRIFLNSLWVLPFLICISIFNPFIDNEPGLIIGDKVVSRGWLSFTTIILRGLLSMQALLLLIQGSGFINIINSLRRLSLPKVLCSQLLLLYRFLFIIIEEANTMHLAMKSRGYGRKSYSLSIWTNIVGSLLLRSYERSKRLHQAMLSRGFDGTFPSPAKTSSFSLKEALFCMIWIGVFAALYFYDLSKLLINVA